MGRVFGAMESCFIATMALGALVTPFAIDAWGLQTALLVLAGPVVVVALLLIAPLRRLDAELHQPAHLALFQAIDIFAPLPPASVETLARSASVFRVPAGSVIVREGDPSDRFYIVESGLVVVTQRRRGDPAAGGSRRLLRRDRAVARRAEDGDRHGRRGHRAPSVERDEFLSVVTGDTEARSAAEVTITRRLGG